MTVRASLLMVVAGRLAGRSAAFTHLPKPMIFGRSNVGTRLATTVAPEETDAVFTELSRLEIRVGRIVDVSEHPTLDKIFVEQIDLGEEEPRTICSGLKGYLEKEDLQDKDCVVVCNLKPR